MKDSISKQAGYAGPDYNLAQAGRGSIEGFDFLAELALDIRWSWNHCADAIWRQLDPELWDRTHNAWVVLQTVSRQRLASLLADPGFHQQIEELIEAKRATEEAPAWFQQSHPEAPLSCVAYFCMEFMLSEALPIYSGGLGNVAGDQLKAASDLGVPVVGVGLLYQQGYFRQLISKDGKQQAVYPYNDPGQLPVTPLRDADGEWLRLEIRLPGYSVWLRTWQVQVGRVRLYLLDSNDAANYPAHRGITSELYGGDAELRFKQELVLGIGGWRLLTALGIRPEVCHLNEGHAGFAVLERARCQMEETGQSFEVALAVTRAGNLFTTHTAVAAGFDHFPPALMEPYLRRYAEQNLGISFGELMALGRRDPHDSSEHFNMAYLAIRGSGRVNGVSRLHGEVSRRLFEPLFPRWPLADIPIGHVTNGIHVPSWDSALADDLWTEACGQDRWMGLMDSVGQNIRRVSDTRLWEFRTAVRKLLIDYARERLRGQLAASGAPPDEVRAASHLLDPNTLTLGFARRFAAYKRPNLLLHDPSRLLRILGDSQRPVQLIIAGKAHPADKEGQALIEGWTSFIRGTEARRHIIFLGDYDMQLTEQLVQGVDVWLNTPRRPWEACGTSGMKVLVNGGLNLSELDGWWAEAHTPEIGWALGDALEHGDDPALDALEAEALYDRLEQEVIPEFYCRDERGIPMAWVARMRESMAQLTPQFSANRSVRQYTEQHYLPAAAAYHSRVAEDGAAGHSLVEWRQQLDHEWDTLRFGEVKTETRGDQHHFDVQVYLDDIDQDSLSVELYAEGLDGGAPERHQLQRVGALIGAEGGFRYTAAIRAERPASDYTARIIPHHPGVAVPLESDHILWHS